MNYFVKEGKEREIYPAKEINLRNLSFLSSPLVLKILSELSKEESCTMDLARKLEQSPQKIYYYIKRLERIGVIKLARKEERVGALAKIYRVISPYVAAKLYNSKPIKAKNIKPMEIEFLAPFIDKGKLNAIIVVGSPDPHGRFGAQASDGYAAIDLALFLGSFITEPEINYRLDTQMREKDLKKNLILIGGPKTNIIVDRINKYLPIYFDERKEWMIISRLTEKQYREDEIGVIIKMKNPFNKKNWILFASGRRFKGTRASIVAIVKHTRELVRGNKYHDGVARVVKGIDKDSDGIIDEVEFLE